MNRLDKELVLRSLAPTRAKAQQLIKNGFVMCDDKVINKLSFEVSPTTKISIIENPTLKYVSRAGLKLDKAINIFNIDMFNKRVMDIGSSTGGFTDCALQNGATSVIAIDVGTNLMDKSLRNNPKITLLEQTNIKTLDGKYFKNLDFITVDVSFISLSHIFEKIFSEQINVDIIALIKPQFECGKKIADKFKGVISSKQVHIDILNNTIEMANAFGFNLLNLDFSPIKGGDGNIEYISLFSNKTHSNSLININNIVNSAFNI